MAYFDLTNNNFEKNKGRNAKIWGISLITVCSAIFLILLTNFFPLTKSVVLGVFGLFAYPLSIVAFCVGIALLNNKKYVMPKKYAIYVLAGIASVLGLLNIIILGNPNNTFFEYLGLSYSFQYTAGGILTGFYVAPLIKTIGIAGAVIILTATLVVFTALIVDFLHTIKTYGFKKAVQKNQKSFKMVEVEKREPLLATKPETAPQSEVKDDFNLFLDKKFEEQENRTALIKLGLIEGNLESAKKPEEKKSIREQLLTPPKIDLSYFNRGVKNRESRETEIKDNLDKLKENYNNHYRPKEYPAEKPSIFENNFNEPEEESKAEEYRNNYLGKNQTNSFPTENETTNYENSIPKPKKFADLSSDDVKSFTPVQENMINDRAQSIYVRPPISLLESREVDLASLNEDVVGKRVQLENTLETFGIKARVIGVIVGPSVTRYEIEMPHGVSVKKITALEDDISLAMAAKSGIRIEAPIPGKSAVGIEVPNDNIATVSLREVLETDEFQRNRSPVTFALGKNISGNPEFCNLAKMPHILIAGATNSGKSICLNTIILSMIYKSSPDDVRLILIDPKRVEFSLYNDLPHLLIPNVITEVDKASNAFVWCVNEMERRFELLQKSRCRNLEEYNKMPEVQRGEAPKMQYIVVVVDELADLMSSNKKDIEESLRRLTQKSRASGILLVLATQRPSVDVVTGIIKTNCPARISFALASNIDSRTILECGGAENLLGKGDMLYKPTDANFPRRVQGCFVSADEIENIVEFIKENNPIYYDEKAKEEIEREYPQTSGNQYEGAIGDPNFDPLLPQALKMFIENGQASTSAIQRRFLAGFPRASRIVDQLCQMGYLTAPDGTKPRNVLITMEEFYQKFGQVD